MARNEDVSTTFWEDEDVDHLSDDAAFIYLWSFTNERCNMAGIYQVKSRSIIEGRMTPARRSAALEELAEQRFLYYVDGWLWVRSRVKRLRTRGTNMGLAVVKMLRKVPEDHPLRAAFLTEYLKNSWVSKALCEAKFEDPSEPLANPSQGLQGLGKGKGLKEKGSGEKGKGADLDALPEDFDPSLVPAVDACLPILQKVAEVKGAKPVHRLPLAKSIAALPNRDHVLSAGELEHWCLHGRGENRNQKDIVATFRNFLKNADPVAKPSRPRTDYDAKTEVIQV